MILGVDEAGRGSLLGPLVLAGVLVGRHEARELAGLGVRDSKQLSPSARDRLYSEILGVAERVEVILVPPQVVDLFLRSTSGGALSINYLEAIVSAKIITKLNPSVCYIDSPDPNPSRYLRRIKEIAGGLGCRVVCMNKADSRIPVVGAASIVAKVTRDREVSRISSTFWDVGSGYPHDPVTIEFLNKWREALGGLPYFVRTGWSSFSTSESKRGASPRRDLKLTDYLGGG